MPAVNVTQEAYDAFTRAVFDKHGKLRGVLQDEATTAILLHARKIAQEKSGHIEATT